MSTAVAHQSEKQVARPLRVLVSLIKEDLKQGDEAATRAGAPFYQAAGEKMIEAKSQMNRGEFIPWIKRNFDRSERQARQYMSFAVATRNIENGAQAQRSLHQHRLDKGERQTVYPQPWHDPVKQIIGRVDTETLNLRQAELNCSEERDAQRKLALQLIDIGYKTLATTLHPDKGGSRDAMARLNQVRDRLKASA